MSQDFGLDRSGNTNHWAVNNMTYSDQMVDSPTNNFATFDPLSMGIAAFGGTLTEGNLRFNGTNGNYHTNARSTIAVQSGKWYAEFYVGTASANSTSVGILGANSLNPPVDGSNLQQSNGSPSFTYESNGDKEVAPVKVTGDSNSTSTSNWGAAYTSAGAIIAVAIDFDSAADGLIYFYKDNTLQTSTYMANDVSLAHSWHFAIGAYSDDVWIANFGQDSSFAGNKTAQGNQDVNGIGDFYYTPPSGYLALCTSNLPEPTVDPRNHFNTVLYTGDGGSQAVTGVGFKPDLVWVKERSSTSGHGLFDIVRGVQKVIRSSDTGIEEDQDNYLTVFGTDGFTIGADGSTNQDGITYVSWNWKAGNANTAFSESGNNPAGTHRANVAAGFSIVSYTGTGAAGTVAHGLGAAPELMLIKNRDVNDEWYVYYGDNTDYLVLDDTDATADAATAWNDTSPSSSVFTVSTSHSVNADAEKYIAYCWRSIEGFSKVGSYTGNGNADGAFIHTGFRPAWVMVKRTDNAENWVLWDNLRAGFPTTVMIIYYLILALLNLQATKLST